MKIILSFTILFVAGNLFAQVGPNAITLSTNRITAATTNSTAGTAFFVGGQKTVAMLLSAYATNGVPGAGGVGDTNGTTSAVTVRFAGSLDGVTYFNDGTNWDLLINPTGTNALTHYRVFDTSQIQYLRQGSIFSTTTNLVFWPSVTYWYK